MESRPDLARMWMGPLLCSGIAAQEQKWRVGAVADWRESRHLPAPSGRFV